MKVFTRVVETSSFTRAADTLGLPRASVTLTIQQLEQYLKVRLLQRTTRRINLTPDGAGYYERCIRILGEIEEAEGSFSDSSRVPCGKLRIDMPTALGRAVVMPRIHEFNTFYPDVELMLGFSDRHADLIQEGVDCAIRIGALEDSSFVARRVGLCQIVTVASPAYLERKGAPATIEALRKHVSTNYFSSRTGRVAGLKFLVDGQLAEVRMRGSIAVNDAAAHLQSGIDGMGVIQTARFMALPHLQAGRLTEVLPNCAPPPFPISTIYPHSRHLSLSVRVFVDWIATLFGDNPLLNASGTQRTRLFLAATADPANLNPIPAESADISEEAL